MEKLSDLPTIEHCEVWGPFETSRRAEPSARIRGPYFSVVIPVYNEEGSLPELYGRLTKVLQQLNNSYEIVFVDDGSSDRSFEILEGLHKNDYRVKVLKFSRNFGHHLAITAGMDVTAGEVVVLMDGDLQDQPEEIPTLFKKLEEGFDVVYGIRAQNKHSLLKRSASRLFFAVMRKAVNDFDLSTGIFRIARRHVIDTVKQCREVNRFVVGLISWVGFRQTGVEVQHGHRKVGETKYTVSKQIRLGVNTITSFTSLPLRISTYLGLICSMLALAYGVIVVVRRVFWGLGEIGWPSLMAVVLFLSGIQLLLLGIFGEYLWRVLIESQHRPLYVVARRLERENRDEGA